MDLRNEREAGDIQVWASESLVILLIQKVTKESYTGYKVIMNSAFDVSSFQYFRANFYLSPPHIVFHRPGTMINVLCACFLLIFTIAMGIERS